MADHDKVQSKLSYSWADPSLRAQAPKSLRRVAGITPKFEAVRRQPANNNESPAFISGSQDGTGSNVPEMIKNHHPYPELRPIQDHGQTREHFNQKWLSEKRRAILKGYIEQEVERAEEDFRNYVQRFPDHDRKR